MKSILVIDDERSVRYSFGRFFSAPEYHIVTARNGREGIAKFKKDPYDLVILDIRLPDLSGLEVLDKLKSIDPRMMALIITAFGTTDLAIEATKKGAYEYILKPFDIPSMKKIIDDAIQNSRLMHTQVIREETGSQTEKSDRIVGNSAVMQEIYKMIGRVAGSDVNILIRGESGTGKELIARAIYQHSNRSDKSFLAVNCAAIPETLLESELFGFEKGAFTGATRRKIGKFELTHKGTIFLDEIGAMTLSTQSKILRVLQEGCFERLGSEETIKADVRIIAATNCNLEDSIREGKFREDLYYRIKVVTITLPPLRLHREDIPGLIDYFLDKHCRFLKKEQMTLPSEVLSKMQAYHWPGNVRELENLIRSAIVLSKGKVISDELITGTFQVGEKQPVSATGASEHIKDEDLVRFHGSLYEKVISEVEKNLIMKVLHHTGGNQVRAAEILGISRVMLNQRIKKYRLKNQEYSVNK